MYLAFKHMHMMFAVLSGAFFMVRGCWMLIDSPRLSQRWVRIAPHINDTFLLVCAIALMFITGQYPFVNDWLTAKVLALLGYIGLGVLALKPGRPKVVRVAAFVAALACFAYIVAVALTHNPAVFAR